MVDGCWYCQYSLAFGSVLIMQLAFDNVTKKFGSITALENITFDIQSGEFVFLTGPSGSGKTTVLRLLRREILPTTGKIQIAGQDIAKVKSSQVSKLRRHFGVVFQDFKLISDRTVFENVALGLSIYGHLGTAEIDKVYESLELTGLSDRADLFPAQLAGGEMQRTCLARAVVGHPDVLLADEPTGNLDVTTSWQIIKLIRKVHKSGTTVIMVTHNVDIVNSFTDRVLLLKNGRLLKDQAHGKYEY